MKKGLVLWEVIWEWLVIPDVLEWSDVLPEEKESSHSGVEIKPTMRQSINKPVKSMVKALFLVIAMIYIKSLS